MSSDELVLRHWKIRLRLRGEEADPGLCIMEHTLEAGYVAMPLRRTAQATVVLQAQQGTLSVMIEGQVRELSPGELALVPRGSWHTFWNRGPAPATFQEIATPGGLDRYYQAVAPLIPPGSTPDVDAVFALSRPHGLEFDLDSLVDLIEHQRVRLA
jgi:mannose-6-phosphate isomerase-like protein (cupin superfamily)